ncbi:MAG: tetratricopeptide repeat protein, partial [Candidatus Thorarchaeota archaeon]
DKGTYKDASQILEEAILLLPEDLSLRGTYALTLYRLGDFTQATIEWDTIHQLNPNLMTATANYAYTLLLQNRIDEATPLVESAFAMDPRDDRALVLKGILALSNGSTESARSFFEKVLEIDPDNVQALSRLAVICHQSGEVDECNKYLENAEHQVESSTECLRGLCYAYSELGRTSRQMDCLMKWTKNDSGAAAPWIALAIEYDKQGNEQEALHAWKKTLELRGYIRINCRDCGHSVRFEIDTYPNFNPYESINCEKCGTLIEMPRGFLTF